MSGKSVIIFTGGLLVGGAAGVFGTKEYFRKQFAEQADAEIEEMQQYYEKQAHELINYFDDEEVNPVTTDAEGVLENDSEDEVEPSDKYSPEEIRERLQRNHKVTTDYANRYKSKDAPEQDNEEEDEESEDNLEDQLEDTSEEALGEGYVEEREKNLHRPPKIISEEALGELPGYVEHKELYFYRLDDILTDENDQIIDDPEYLIGDALDKYNFRESSEQIIFVRNYALDTVYEIQKLEAAFDE